MTVELLSCETGKGVDPIAQQLANELNATVIAPTTLLWYSSEGIYGPYEPKPFGENDIQPDHDKPGIMKVFTSKCLNCSNKTKSK